MSRTLATVPDQHDHGRTSLPLLLALLTLTLTSLTAAAPRELVPSADDSLRPVEGTGPAPAPAAPPPGPPRSAAPADGYVRSRDGRRVAVLRPADLLQFRRLVAPHQRWPQPQPGGQRVLVAVSSAALTAELPDRRVTAEDSQEEEEEQIMARRSNVRAVQEELLEKAVTSAVKEGRERGGQESEEEEEVGRREEEQRAEGEQRTDAGDVEGSGSAEDSDAATPATLPLMPLDEEHDETATEPAEEPAAEAGAEPVPEPVAEPVAEHVEEPVEEPVAAPVAEPVAVDPAPGHPAPSDPEAGVASGSASDTGNSQPTGAGSNGDETNTGDGSDADGDGDDDDDDDGPDAALAAVVAGAALPAASVPDSGSSGSDPEWSGSGGPSRPVPGVRAPPGSTPAAETVRREARGSAPDQQRQLSTAEISAVAVGCVLAAAAFILGTALVVQRTGVLQRRSILSEPPLDDTRLSYINASTDFSVSELGDEMTNLENLDNDSFLNSLESMTDSMTGQTCWSREVRHLKL
ncbi:actin cytoskeleton-regulatory complex protein PAN1-like [Amphibalanus amphitrite]|uniref:actin cytoskeleton-regulatory complex protein PAN1-like n=1 Tax=Amphibalanus amphitrite TaxID=1232801 RepID=UPI001C90AEAA|nr:actin cytoskeleton-regulatory complex protein PAN1-like [Amphibalanus amphitrite]XP_043235376.1 actin cytoskeleton-regulatory complex protein PAN1-like [Amphibalanus amphitrite]XP_043235377.1 actin cytoskeleton-regulatory complex protein PAN1-like [Amphibalanus amphitrite]XP_043235379.1 actin cytoskeleton-regulatory complex protein PAN1-like [Amphibalanus amphitrite]XP_043235380.1 actin cytoskeleton-regulatory complex protein PAN1-like [Amphibalanus amphitrite]XP_043235381.1 actin cytoskele